MKINKSYLIAGTLFMLIAIWFLLHSGKSDADADNGKNAAAQERAAPPTVVVENRTAQAHDYVLTLYGRTEAARQVSVKAQTAGVVSAAPTREGARVAKGAMLCQQDIDARQAMVDQASANLRATEIDLNAARTLAQKGFQSATRVSALEAQMDVARASIKQAEIELDNVNIRAPFFGIWERQSAEIGDYLSPGQPCGLLVELNPLLVTAELTETQMGKITIGDAAIAVLATGEQVSGKVRLIEAIANPKTRTFRMEVELPNKDYTLRAGVTTDLKIKAGTITAQLIPSQILTLDDSGEVGVRYVGYDDIVNFARVTTVDESASGIWVTGLPDQARIIVQGQDYVAVGSTVTPVFSGGASASSAY